MAGASARRTFVAPPFDAAAVNLLRRAAPDLDLLPLGAAGEGAVRRLLVFADDRGEPNTVIDEATLGGRGEIDLSALCAGQAARATLTALGHDVAKVPRPLAWHFSTRRHPAFAKATVFEQDAGGRVMVRRRRLSPVAAPALPIRLILEDEPLLTGRDWQGELDRIVARPGWTAADIAAWFAVWVAAVATAAGVSREELAGAPLPGRMLDATPFNLMVGEDGAGNFFDLEWEWADGLSFKRLAYRALRGSLMRVRARAAPARLRHRLIAPLIVDVARDAGVRLHLRDLPRLEAEELALQAMVARGRVASPMRAAFRIYRRRLRGSAPARRMTPRL